MEAKDLIQKGDVFKNDFEEYEVVGWSVDGEQVRVENLAGMTERMGPRELIEVATE